MRKVVHIEDEQQKHQAASWMAAVAVQRLWRGLKGRRKLGQVGGFVRAWVGDRGMCCGTNLLRLPVCMMAEFYGSTDVLAVSVYGTYT